VSIVGAIVIGVIIANVVPGIPGHLIALLVWAGAAWSCVRPARAGVASAARTWARIGVATFACLALYAGSLAIFGDGGGLSRQAACVQVRAAYANSNEWYGTGSDSQFLANLSSIKTTDAQLQGLINSAVAAQQQVVDAENNYDSASEIVAIQNGASGPETALLNACTP
jgi:hypothetical protein